MAKDKEKKFNPVAAAHKAEKNRQIKKGKAVTAAQRTERLAKRNPYHLQRQLVELKEAKERGELDARFLPKIDGLEKEVRAIKKAREEMGIKDDEHEKRRGSDEKVLGKRRREDSDRRPRREEEESETDEDAKGIPMPEDIENEPPIPRRKPKHPNGDERKGPHPLPPKPVIPSKDVYEAKPVLRDLHKEAARKFVPAVVAANLRKAKGEAGLLEPEELEALEKAGYRTAKKATEDDGVEKTISKDDPSAELDEEMRRFEEEIGITQDTETLREEVIEDAHHVTVEAENEAVHSLMANEAQVRPPNSTEQASKKMAPSLPGLVAYSDSEDDDEANDVREEAEKTVDTAEYDAQFNVMADDDFDEFGNPVTQAKKIEQRLRKVEIEEVSDEDL